MLLNFRDAWPAYADGGGGDGGVGCARALAAVRVAAAACNGAGDGDSADDGPPAEVAALATSLMDGWGLADLHPFVALPHLARAERDLRARTDRARGARVARRWNLRRANAAAVAAAAVAVDSEDGGYSADGTGAVELPPSADGQNDWRTE